MHTTKLHVRNVSARFVALSICTAAIAQQTDADERLAAVRQAEQARVDAIDRVAPSVVAIYGNNRQGGGSGVLFDPAGFALTNHHVVAAAGDEGWAGLSDGRFYRWKLYGTDPGGDIAIIRLSGRDEFPIAPLGETASVDVGDWVLAMGNPFTLADDQTPTVTLGIVSGIGRFQEGAQQNILVYGNCLQIDTSINPGNSGGPSFDAQGRVIGINGRISAMERGRVNVGVGYAISIDQAKNFIPDLLATKLAQHGTLDAQFATRGGRVICQAINLDSPAARAGLRLGDRLVSFQGEPIESTNEFTNLVSTYPAGWPVHVSYERDGQPHSLTVRLTPLLYNMPKQPTIKIEPKPTPDGKNLPRMQASGPNLGTQGEIRDAKLNAGVARLLVDRWWKSVREDRSQESPAAVRIQREVIKDQRAPERRNLVVSSDGRFRVDLDDAESIAFDGSSYLARKDDDSEARTLSAAEALADPAVVEAAALAIAMRSDPGWKGYELLLEGGDVAQSRRAFRLKITDPAGGVFRIWLAADNAELLKTGVKIDGTEASPATVYRQHTVDGLRLPQGRKQVSGLTEDIEWNLTGQVETLSKLPDDLLRNTADDE